MRYDAAMANTTHTAQERVALLLARGFTLRKIASEAGLGLGTVAEISSGKTENPSERTARKISAIKMPRARMAQNTREQQ